MRIPRKRCPKCRATIEGEGVRETYSCDVCGNGYLSVLPDLIVDEAGRPDQAPEPRGGGQTIIHTRDDY